MRRALAPLLFALASGCTLGGGNVIRVYSGREVPGPYITPEAYAHYAQGVLDESQGNFAKALREYEAALADDDSSPDLWTRVAAVQCRLGKDPTRAFQRAESLDPDFSPLWRERARCALDRGDAARALPLAERAVALDPLDPAASLLVARALEKLGRPADARRWLLALALWDPTSKPARLRLHPTEPTPARRSDPLGARGPGERRASVEDVDRALRLGDTEGARRLAKEVGQAPSALALRAAALGHAALAKAEAERVLAADPDDSDARIALLVAATLAGDQAAYETALSELGPEPLAPSPLGVRLLGELLGRRAGSEAAEIWRSIWALPAATDRLEAAVEQRAGTPNQ